MKNIDPILLFLNHILQGFFKANLKEEEIEFVGKNIQKHRVALWVNVLACVFVFLGLWDTPTQAIGTVIASLLAPVMLLGTAWFGISFGGIPEKLIKVSMETTLWMFIAFLISLSAMFIAVAFVTSLWLWPVLAIIYIGVIIGCIQYDTADGLKAGLDDAMLRHSRYAIAYYEKEGIGKNEKES